MCSANGTEPLGTWLVVSLRAETGNLNGWILQWPKAQRTWEPIGSEIGHVGVVCLVAPLAMAEAIGGVSGRDFIVASAVACEVSARMTAAIARTGRRPSVDTETPMVGLNLHVFQNVATLSI